MTDIEEEQPTQQRGRRDWSDKGKGETSLEDQDELGGEGRLVPSPETVGEANAGEGDGEPGGTLLREGEPDGNKEGKTKS